jgi:hypothetical protein
MAQPVPTLFEMLRNFSDIALLKIKTNQKNKALKMSTTKPFSQWTVLPFMIF